MKPTLKLLLAAPLLLFALCAAAPPASKPRPAPIALPIEVMGEDGTTQTLSLTLPRPAAMLSLEAHGLENEQEASVRVGSAPWVPLTNKTCFVAEPGRSYGGIGGGFATVRLLLPMRAPSGACRLQFRFNHTDGVNSGFRILSVNFLDKSSHVLLAQSVFTQHDPAMEKPPLPGASDIKAGRTLWHSVALRESPMVHTNLKVTCSDCHAEDGRDLKYYGYTNNSIYERCLFHGLSHTQAEQIASYIRTLPVRVTGRPWNPPYQPGAGMDKKPAQDWAAGAGLSAVLPTDAAMLPYLFPNGIAKAGIGAQDTLNMRELPIALQLPDWNHWLPRIHPKDAFGDAFTNSTFAAFYDGHGPNQDSHGNLRTILANPDTNYHHWFTDNPDASIYHFMGYWSEALQGTFMAQHQQGANWTPSYVDKMESVALWRLVKDWELMQEYHLESDAPQIFPTGKGAPLAGEKHSWLSESAFLASPAFVGVPENGAGHTRLEYEYRTNAWYYLQTVLNSGNRHRQGWHPVDWGYAIGRTGNLATVSGQPGMLRTTAMLIKAMQQSDTDGTVDTTYGWFPHFAGDMRFFYWMHGTPDGGDLFSLSPDKNAAVYAQIATAVTGAQFDEMQRFTGVQYQNSTQGGENSVVYGGDSLFHMQQETLGDLTKVGVEPSLLRREAAWDKTVWPNIAWDALMP